MPEERNKITLKMLCNRLLFTVLFSGFFMLSTQVSIAQDGGTADTTQAAGADEQAAPTTGAAGVPTDAETIAKGKALFSNNCTVCHAVHEQVVGPALANVTERRPIEWIIKFVHGSQKVIQGGDDYAVNLYNKFNKTQMPNFDYFSEDEIKSIMGYIQQESKVAQVSAETAATGEGSGASVASNSSGAISSEYLTLIVAGFIFVLILILVVLILLVVVLTKFMKSKQDLDAEDREIVEQKANVGKVLKSKAFIGLLTFIFVALAMRAVIEGLYTIGTQQGYSPTQPIAFSHALHAGKFQIDCNYCHTGVRKSKNANIPSANICMNCHSMIKRVTGATEDSKEIKKIYDAIANNQPIEWVRIHNLPDLVYFNHSQHVDVAGLECQTCHGPIEEMAQVRQYAPLTMGWCINCHRETKINTDNAYYDKLVELHATVSKEPMTVEDIGGLECARCHY